MKVIVTRPHQEATAWVQQLRDLHFDAVALPLIHIGAASNQDGVAKAWESLHQYSAAMFVSSNAVRHFFSSKKPLSGVFADFLATKNIVNLEQKLAKPRMWATGPGTREALLAQAVPSDLIDSPARDAVQFDSETLWNAVKNQVKQGDKVLIVRGRSHGLNNVKGVDANGVESVNMNGRPWLADQLVAAGVQVDEVVSYERSTPVFDAIELDLLRQASADQSVWLFSSSEAVANLCAVSGAISGLDWSKARAIATHPRIAQAARDAGFGVVYESRPLLSDVAASIESLL